MFFGAYSNSSVLMLHINKTVFENSKSIPVPQAVPYGASHHLRGGRSHQSTKLSSENLIFLCVSLRLCGLVANFQISSKFLILAFYYLFCVIFLPTSIVSQTLLIEDRIHSGETSTADKIIPGHPRLWLKGDWDWDHNNVGSFAWRIIHGEEKPWPWQEDPANDQEKQEFAYVAGADGEDSNGADNMYQNYAHDFSRRMLEPIIAGKAQKLNWRTIYRGSYRAIYHLDHSANQYFSDAKEKLLNLVRRAPEYEYPFVVALFASVAYDWLVNETDTHGNPVLSESDKTAIQNRLLVHGDYLFNHANSNGSAFKASDTDYYYFAMIGMALYEPSRDTDSAYSTINARAKVYLDEFDRQIIGKILPVWNEQGGDGGWHGGLTRLDAPYWLGGTYESDDNVAVLMMAPVFFAHYTATGSVFEESLFNTGILKNFAEFQLHMIAPSQTGQYGGTNYYDIGGGNIDGVRSPWIIPMRAYSRRRFSKDAEQRDIAELGAWIRTSFNKTYTDAGSWDMLEQLLFEDKWVNPRNPEMIGFPATRHFQKLGWVFMRSGFTSQNDLAALFICQRYHWSHLDPHAQNSFTLEYGGKLVEGYGNTIFINGKGQRTITRFPVISDGVSAYAPSTLYDVGPGITYFESNSRYDYVFGDATRAYNPAELKKFTRQLVYLKPDVFIIFDHVVTTSPGITKSWVIDPGKQPEKLTDDFYRITNGNGALWIKRMLPADINAISQTANKFEVASASNHSVEYFLHVLQTTHAGLGPNNPVVIADDTRYNENQDSIGITVGRHSVSFSKSGSPGISVSVSSEPGNGFSAVPGPDFTLIGLPDTQYYTSSKNGGSPAIFNRQIQWIVANKDAMNIAYVAHLGDCVENGDRVESEWQIADAIMRKLENPRATNLPDGLPFGLTVGNHDQSPEGNPGGTTALFNRYFGTSRFLGRSYYGHHYGSNNNNHFDLFSASGLDFIVIHLEYDPTPDAAVMAWADSVLQIYHTRRAIIVSHYIIETGNPGYPSVQGKAIYAAFKDNPNVFLFLCGHVGGEGQRSDIFEGSTIHTLLANYQHRPNGGSGWLRIMEFSPANNEIRVKTYSPWLDQWETDSNSQFTLYYDMQSGAPSRLPVSSILATSGSAAGIEEPALSPPAALTGFEGAANRNTARLAWEIGSSYISHGFEVERSHDGRSYYSISFVKAIEGSLTNQRYEYIDRGLYDGHYYYRLKIWHPDGTFEYSRIIEIDVKVSDRFNFFRNYPNPFHPFTGIGYCVVHSPLVDLIINEN